ncbi:MurR/RpiR family transcriptional regulator [bacterium Scap17]|nr:MurR/RpiR family transcriptional regulator [bacterium Scap17]
MPRAPIDHSAPPEDDVSGESQAVHPDGEAPAPVADADDTVNLATSLARHAARQGTRSLSLHQRLTRSLEELTPNEQRIARFLLAHQDELALYNAAELSRLTDVSKATVSRLFRRLGYQDFREARDQARSLRQSGVPVAAAPTADHHQRHYEQECRNLRQALAALDMLDMEALSSALAKAERLQIIGFRNAYPLALHLRQQLLQLRAQVAVLPQPGQSLGEEVARLGADDAVVVFAMRRRPQGLARLLEWLGQAPCTVLLVCDDSLSTIPAGIEHVLRCPLDSVSAFDSYAAAMSQINLLATRLLHDDLVGGRSQIRRVTDTFDALEELGDG